MNAAARSVEAAIAGEAIERRENAALLVVRAKVRGGEGSWRLGPAHRDLR